MKPDYFVGLDLGQPHEFTALAVLERSQVPDPEQPALRVAHYAVRHLERFKLGTPYTAVRDRMVELFADSPLSGSKLPVDATAVGRAIIDMLRRSGIKARIQPICITGGHSATVENGTWLVPKKDLVGTLQVLLQARRITVSPLLPDAAILVQELTSFQAKITQAANDTVAEWRNGRHDDLVLALAVAAWWAERHPLPHPGPGVVPIATGPFRQWWPRTPVVPPRSRWPWSLA